MKSLPKLEGYEQIAGHLALDFVNTLGGGREHNPKENLHSYAHLVAWSRVVGIISETEADKLCELAEKNELLANEVLNRAKLLREAIYRIAVGEKRESSSDDLFLISREATIAMGRAKICSNPKGYSWSWKECVHDLDRVLWPVARAAAELITSEEMEHVRRCASKTCTWTFLDTSKNHRRRWCVMRDCGNRDKVRRFRGK